MSKKKTEAKNKLKGTIVIHALPMNIPDFRGKDTLMHDSFGGEPPKFVVNKPRMAVDYMKPEHSITPKSKPAKSPIEIYRFLGFRCCIGELFPAAIE